MGRSSGYRARQHNAEEVAELRSILGELRSHQWQKASVVMSRIVALTGGSTGPSGGGVEPRACKYCSYYGHTRQHCVKRKRDEEANLLREKERSAAEIAAREEERRERAMPKEYQRRTQEEWLDELRVPWYRDDLLGAMPLCGDGGEGKWIRQAGTVKIAVE